MLVAGDKVIIYSARRCKTVTETVKMVFKHTDDTKVLFKSGKSETFPNHVKVDVEA